MSPIDGIQSSVQSFARDSEVRTGVQAQTGTFRGETAVVDHGPSTLADAAEELCLYAAEKVEHKSLDERSVETDTQGEVARVEALMAYLAATQGVRDEKELAALVKRMQSGGENPQELARRESRDPTRQYALMQYALQDGIESGASEEALDALRDALAELEIDHGPQIRAGLNTVGAAAEFSPGPEHVAAFQNTYRDVVLGESTLGKTLGLILERHAGREGEEFPRFLQSLIKAAGQDLAAARPSIDPVRLQSLVEDLYQLEVTATVMDGCKDLAREMAARHGCAGVQPLPMMKDLVAVTGEKWVSSGRFAGMADKFGVRDTGPQIAYLAATRNLLRDMPVKIFPDGDVRRSILDAVQEALDRAIEREDE